MDRNYRYLSLVWECFCSSFKSAFTTISGPFGQVVIFLVSGFAGRWGLWDFTKQNDLSVTSDLEFLRDGLLGWLVAALLMIFFFTPLCLLKSTSIKLETTKKQFAALKKPTYDMIFEDAIELVRENKAEWHGKTNWEIAEHLFRVALSKNITIWGCAHRNGISQLEAILAEPSNPIDIPYRFFERPSQNHGHASRHFLPDKYGYVVENHSLTREGVAPCWSNLCVDKGQICHAVNISA